MFTVPSAIFFEAYRHWYHLTLERIVRVISQNDGRAMLLIIPHDLYTAMILSLLILLLISDGLRDAFDPKMRK